MRKKAASLVDNIVLSRPTHLHFNRTDFETLAKQAGELKAGIAEAFASVAKFQSNIPLSVRDWGGALEQLVQVVSKC